MRSGIMSQPPRKIFEQRSPTLYGNASEENGKVGGQEFFLRPRSTTFTPFKKEWRTPPPRSLKDWLAHFLMEVSLCVCFFVFVFVC